MISLSIHIKEGKIRIWGLVNHDWLFGHRLFVDMSAYCSTSETNTMCGTWPGWAGTRKPRRRSFTMTRPAPGKESVSAKPASSTPVLGSLGHPSWAGNPLQAMLRRYFLPLDQQTKKERKKERKKASSRASSTPSIFNRHASLREYFDHLHSRKKKDPRRMVDLF
ncbi:hypothetical protein WAI453_003971 [Rhynchosporium graminicola]